MAVLGSLVPNLKEVYSTAKIYFRGKPRGIYPPKIENLEQFRVFAQAHGHLTQQAMAQQWEGDISDRTIGKALKRLGFTRKKRPMAT